MSTIYAYLGEMHSNATRERAVMISAVVYSVGCIWDPIQAYFVINGEWQFYIPFIDVVYKPWRLLIIVCGLPGLLSAVALLFFPESPRFVLNQGDTKQTFEIVQQINRWNNGGSSELSFGAIENESEPLTNCTHEEKSKDLLTTVWVQTVPLFKPPYLKPTVLICTIMMFVSATAIG